MLKKADNLLLLVKRFLLLLLFYSVARILFLVFNLEYFSDLGFKNLIFSFASGIRFDISSIIITNLPVILLHFFSLPFFYSAAYQKFIKAVFMLINIPCIFLNCIDFDEFLVRSRIRSEEHTSELQSLTNLVCRLLLEKKKRS